MSYLQYGIKTKLVFRIFIIITSIILLLACNSKDDSKSPNMSENSFYNIDTLMIGADLSYANQILDNGGVYKDSGEVENPYKIFSEYGANTIRLRLWKDPSWEKSLNSDNENYYSNFDDVFRSIEKIKTNEMAVNLDFHYSDNWADPSTQEIPKSWRGITDIEVLSDSVYHYTKRELKKLNKKGLMPEFVQIGNEINCGFMYSDAPKEFPNLNGCEGHWQNLGKIINSGIKAVKEITAKSDVNTKIILHVAQPENVNYFFKNIMDKGSVNEFNIIGFSYYSYFSDISLSEISTKISDFIDRFNKEVMIVETAYPWTLDNNDDYENVLNQKAIDSAYPATPTGQKEYMIALTQQVISGGGMGITPWEPDWITSKMQTQFGTGSSYENSAFFDFDGNSLPVFDFYTYPYDFNN